jgi:hypothetical protein
MTVTDEVKRMSLIAFTGAVVSFVRSKVLSHTWFWPSISDFIGEWFFCSVIVLFILIISYVAISSYQRAFFRRDIYLYSELSQETTQVLGSFIILIASVASLFVSMVPRGN